MNKLLSIELRKYFDPDSSPLDYTEKSDERYKSWTRYEWAFCGIKAVASIGIKIPKFVLSVGETNLPFSYNVQTITSGGLWGIEDDSDTEHLEAIIDDELKDLKDILEELNVDVSNFDSLVSKPYFLKEYV